MKSNPYIKPMIQFAIETAVRKGELFKIKYNDIDFNNKMIMTPKITPLVIETISNDANRGGWLLNEKLFLSAGLEPLDKSLCDSIELRSQTVWTPSGKERPCHLYDLFPPFRVFKNAHSDTLFVEYDNRTILFEIPSHHCQ